MAPTRTKLKMAQGQNNSGDASGESVHIVEKVEGIGHDSNPQRSHKSSWERWRSKEGETKFGPSDDQPGSDSELNQKTGQGRQLAPIVQ